MNIFIAGMEKCGTSALADWLTINNLAEYLVPNVKEPYIYATGTPNINSHGISTPLLDASVGYSLNCSAIAKLPEHNTKIIICLRNQFERTWSSYKMKKIAAKHEDAGTLLLHEFPSHLETSKYYQAGDILGYQKFITKLHYPRKSNEFIEKYFQIEVENFRNQNFEERVKYEISFLLRRRHTPFLSILEHSFYTFPLKNLFSRFINEDITLVSVNKLRTDEKLRASFCSRIFATNKSTLPIEEKFSSKNFSIDEDMPNFNDDKWNFLRDFFKDDFLAIKKLALENVLSDEFIDNGELSKYVI